MARRTVPLLTFAEKTSPILELCHAVLSRHGERCEGNDLTRPGFYRGGYWFAEPVHPESEADYALRILFRLRIASTTTDRETALKFAWDAGQEVLAAHVKFKRLRSAIDAATAAGEAHRQRALDDDRYTEWEIEIRDRRTGRTKGQVIRAIADREGLTPDAVKKSLQRHRDRKKRHPLEKS
jgi:hypothetical protein